MKLKYRVMERFRDKYSIAAMCLVFEVSRSGYMIPFCSSPFEKAAFDSTRVKFRPQFAGETALFPAAAAESGGSDLALSAFCYLIGW